MSIDKNYPFPEHTADGRPSLKDRPIRPSDVLRAVAEYLADEMTPTHHRYVHVFYRRGCCSAFNNAPYDENLLKHWTQSAISRAVDRAQQLFRSIYHRSTPSGYWFGSGKTRAEQEHRIIALLITADMAESVGE